MANRVRHVATRAGGASLFDRLIEDDGSIPTQERLDPRATVLRDLRRLLNTRRAGTEMLAPESATVLDYGIPNFTPMSSLQDMERLGDLIANAIRIFEPRLGSPQVLLRPLAGRPDRVLGSVSGVLEVDGRPERILFPLAIDPQAGEAQILPPASEG